MKRKKIIGSAVTVVSAFLLFLFIAPAAYGVFHVGNVLGIAICLYFIFRFGASALYCSFRELFLRRKATKIVWTVINALLTAFAVYAVAVSGLMICFSMIAPAENSRSTAVVLGAQVKPWGPSALLRQRIDAGEEYLKSHSGSVAVVTGGQGSDEIMSEAQCMYECMTADGIAPERIYREDKATNTEQNIRFSMKIISENKLEPNIAIVTDSYHQFRARIIARKQGVRGDITSVNTENGFVGAVTYPAMFVREWLAVPAELLKPSSLPRS